MSSDNSQEYKKITEDLYKKNLELFNVNRQLTLLQELYQIIISTLTIQELSQKFINAIVGNLDFYAGAVFYHNENDPELRLIAVTNTKSNIVTEKLTQVIGKTVTFSEENNVLIKAFNTREVQTTNSIAEVVSPVLEHNDIDAIIAQAGLKSFVVFPISFGVQALGSYVVFLRREIDELNSFDQETLKRCSIVFGVAIDRLMIYLSLQSANQQLKELDQRKNEFLNMAAHELRAPMTAIKGYISMLIEGDAGEIPEKARGFLTDAQGVTERLIRLVNNMLNVSRIEENRMVFQVEDVHLAEVARTVFSEFQGEAVRKNLQFDLEIPNELRDLVTVDSDRIHEVIANFLSNAIKYTEKGFVKLTLSEPESGYVRVAVSDSGLGISEDEQKKLFQKFSRAESAVGKTVGTGLGLYITKLLVEKFNGRIGLHSEAGQGSTFWFEIPLTAHT